MKGKPEVIDSLNSLLKDELTAINQYFVHAEMCEDWGYEALHEVIDEYNKAVRLAADLGDNGTKQFLDGILHDEEDHLDYIEEVLDQIDQMGIQNYLTTVAG